MTYKLNIVEYPRDGEKLVFLHGLGGTYRYWLTGLDTLKQHYHVILVDLLGFGDSDKPWINYTKERHLLALENALNGLGSFSLVGHSLGASLALAYSARNPLQVRAQVLISLPVFATKQTAFQWARRSPGGWLLTNMVTTIATCLMTRHIVGRFLPQILSNYPLEVAQDILKHNFLSSTTTLWQVVYNTTVISDAGHLSSSIDTLCLHCLDDDTAPYIAVAEFVAKEGSWEMIALENGAHHPWLWNNQQCIDIVCQFVNLKRRTHQSDKRSQTPIVRVHP